MEELVKTHPFFKDNERDFPIRFRPAETSKDILQKSLLPFLPIQGFQVPYTEMYAEAKRLEKAAIPHRAAYESHRGWKSLVLHGISSVHTQGAEQYGMNPDDQDIYDWTDLSRLCPVTTQFFKHEFSYESYQRVRFMYLEPGGYVMPHTDADRYYLGPVNIALNNPRGCRFLMKDIGEVPFAPGQINKLALVNQHAVFNDGNETRIHMIVHGSPDFGTWEPIYLDSYKTLVTQNPRFRPEPVT